MTSPIMEARVTGAEVARICTNLQPVLEGETREAAVISLLTEAFILMKPDVTADEIEEGVKGASGWMVLFLAEHGVAGEDELPEHEKRLLAN